MNRHIKQKLSMLFLSIVAFASVIAVPQVFAGTCGGVQTSIITCSQAGGTGTSSGIWGILILVLNILTGGIGIAAVGGIVYGAMLYASAGDKAEQTKKAIGIITNVVIGIVAYGLMYIVLNFLIPGGIFT